MDLGNRLKQYRGGVFERIDGSGRIRAHIVDIRIAADGAVEIFIGAVVRQEKGSWIVPVISAPLDRLPLPANFESLGNGVVMITAPGEPCYFAEVYPVGVGAPLAP